MRAMPNRNVRIGSRAAVPSTVAHRRSAFNYRRTLTLPKSAVIARNVRAQFLKGSDLSRPGRASRPPIRHEQRHRAAAQAYMAIAPPSTWISEPVM